MFERLKESILGPIGFIMFAISKRRSEKKALRRSVIEILDGMDRDDCTLWKTSYMSTNGNYYGVEFRKIKLDQTPEDYFKGLDKEKNEKE